LAIQLLAYFSLFFALAFVLPSYRVWRRDGVNALVLPADDTAHGLVGRLFKATIVCTFLLLTALSFGLPEAAGPLPWLETGAVRIAGWAVLGLSLAWIIAAQAQMGASWRIGIDQHTRTELVTTGVFGLSRNPIFLGMRTGLLGLFLVLPNALTLAILVLGEALMQVQVRLEEAHLQSMHDRTYEQYRATVRRWI
jgi:protein-S-isoprenylcysteine O-methyltransferase Ste14